MFKTFRGLTEALRGVIVALDRLQRTTAEELELRRVSGDMEQRLAELEGSRAIWEAEIQADWLKAEGSRQASMNAEARTRTMKKYIEKNSDPFDLDSDQTSTPVQDVVPLANVNSSEAEGMYSVPMGLEDQKQQVLRAKFL